MSGFSEVAVFRVSNIQNAVGCRLQQRIMERVREATAKAKVPYDKFWKAQTADIRISVLCSTLLLWCSLLCMRNNACHSARPQTTLVLLRVTQPNFARNSHALDL